MCSYASRAFPRDHYCEPTHRNPSCPFSYHSPMGEARDGLQRLSRTDICSENNGHRRLSPSMDDSRQPPVRVFSLALLIRSRNWRTSK